MSRPLRIEFAGALYHITARGNERKPIYRCDDDRRRFLAILADAVEDFGLLLHAYVLMDNHYHLLLETLEANLSRAMHALNGIYAQGFNRRHSRVGHLLQGRYKSPLIQHDAYLVELSRYIHLNPVRAGIVAHAENYRWSSARAYLGKCHVPRFLTIVEVLGHFDGRLARARRAYKSFLAEASPGRSPLNELVGQTLLGEPDWVEAMRARIDACIRAGRLPLDISAQVPALRCLPLRPTVEQIIAAVAAATRTKPEMIRRAGGKTVARAAAIYLAHKRTGLTQHDVGVAFGIKGSAVSRAIAAMTRTSELDRRSRRLLECVTLALQSPLESNIDTRQAAARNRTGARS